VRYAIVSDIHGNLEALSAVLARVSPDDEVLCLGDVVGYGPQPNECIAAVRARASVCVLGNHDVAAVDGYGLQYFNPYAKEAMAYTRRVIAPEALAWLDELAYEHRAPRYLLVHGAPVDYFSYILDKDDAARAFGNTDAPLIFVGHSHIAEYYELAPGAAAPSHKHMQHGGTLELRPESRYVINVGSVGQPRDLNPEASFALYDEAGGTVVWERVPYAIGGVQEKMEAAGLPDWLLRRLNEGR
jgi:diadenosine tetraphosphatase ApaH/serine/threonine PP2A family protein phosphatase